MFQPTHTNIIVFGNGPSLKGFDFAALQRVDSLGMNAAYRHWERIGWYPTHYACLDDQLIETHADAIYDMIVSGKVKTAFLITKILDYHPDLVRRENVYFLESFNKTRHARVAHRGVSYVDSLPFRESDPSKVTTGAYAVRFAAHLGYGRITLLGIDLRYVEIIPEARRGDGIKLVMDATPSRNPNYFFDDYQRAGDKFNIPNPASHNTNLHVAAFEALAVDIARFDWPACVINGNRQSVLHDKAIFPIDSPDDLIRGRTLGAVVIPTTLAEESQLLQNLRAWDQPRLIPSIGRIQGRRPDLIFAFSGADNAALRARIVKAYEETRHVRRCFERVEVRFIGLDPALDYYQRDYSKPIGGRGFKSGPNEQFFELMHALAGSAQFIFYMESDCAPLRQGWLDRIRELAEGDHESWVIGSIYRGTEPISDRFFLHLNGNALYRVGDPEFMEFVEKYWRPWLYRTLDTTDKRLAYDCVLSHRFSLARPAGGNLPWREFQQVWHRFRATGVIQNISGAADLKADALETLRGVLQAEPQTCLVHGRQFTRLLHAEVAAAAAVGDNFSWSAALKMHAAVPCSRPRWSTSLDHSLPRLLVLDPTATGSASATGQIKQMFLESWPPERLLQVYEGGGRLQLQRFVGNDCGLMQEAALLEACVAFRPQAVYFRPVDSLGQWRFAQSLRAAVSVPWVIHIMDDWPERLRAVDPALFGDIDESLRLLISEARECLSISEGMSAEYRRRYNREFLPLANGVDVEASPRKNWSARAPVSAEHPFVIRYLGGLARDMNRESVLDLAAVVSELSRSMHVRLEIYTMNWYMEEVATAMAGMPGVTVHGLVSQERYASLLAESDALVIAYNFDDDSVRYVRLSMANKLPECLAAGVPILAYGPRAVATMAAIEPTGCAVTVADRSATQLTAAVRSLVENLERCHRLGDAARRHAGMHFDRAAAVHKFRAAICRAVESPPGASASAAPALAVEQAVRASTVDSTPTPQASKSLLTNGAGSLSVANRLFRSGDYSGALAIYLELCRREKLQIYRDNALLAARRLGRVEAISRQLKDMAAS